MAGLITTDVSEWANEEARMFASKTSTDKASDNNDKLQYAMMLHEYNELR